LIEVIEEADEANLVLLVAPAGYGKTTAAQQILDRQQSGVKAWYHLDASDTNLERFMTYLIEALRGVLPKFTRDLAGININQLTEDVCFAVERYRGPQAYLVLDNWECVDHISDIASIPPLLVRSGQGKISVVIASRVSPSFKFRREQARGNILLLDSTQLAFSLSECQEVLRLRLGRDIEDEAVVRFWKETSGWCVSAGLLPTKPPQSGLPDLAHGKLSPKHIGVLCDHFMEEVYETLSPDLAGFLCETSLFEVITVERCAAVISAPEKVEGFLDELGRSAVPHIVLERQSGYRLHALVRQIFRSHLEETTEPERFAALCRTTANRYLTEGLTFEAISLFMELGEYERALDLMDTRWTEVYGQHGWTQVKTWLEAFPADYHNRTAFIKTYSNVLNVSGDNKGAIAFLRDKLSPDRFADDPESFGSLWANYWWSRINTEWGPHYDSVKKDHDALTAVARGFSPTMLGIFQNTLGMAAHLELHLEEAIAHVRKAAELIEEPYPRLRIVADQNLALYLHLRGESVDALNLLNQARDDCRRLSLQSQISKLHMLEASIHLDMGYYREALSDIHHCITAMREFGTYSLQLDAYVDRFRGLALWYLGDRTEGLRLLKSARETARQFSVLTGMEVELLDEYYSLLSDNPISAVGDQEIPARVQRSVCHLIFLALEATKSYRGQDLAGLKQRATAICDVAMRCEMPQWVATGSFFLAMSLTGREERKRQADLLETGLSHLRRAGWRSYPMANDEITAFVLAKATSFGIDSALIEVLLSGGSEIDLTPAFRSELKDTNLPEEARIRLWEAASRLAVRGLVVPFKEAAGNMPPEKLPAMDKYREFLSQCGLPPLRIEMLGGFSVTAGGRTVQFNRSASRLLFQNLLVVYPRKMHEEELIESVWPETDPNKGRASLRTAIKDLRKALDPYAVQRGPSYIVYVDRHYGLELPAKSRVDHLDFASLIGECLRKQTTTTIAVKDRIAGLRRALEIYRGPLLPMLPYESFVIERREEYQVLYQKGTMLLAQLLIADKSLEDATAAVEKAMVYDRLWTDGVRLLLQIHSAQGEILKAMRVYRNYEKRLQDELGLPADADIRDYFNEIVKTPVS